MRRTSLVACYLFWARLALAQQTLPATTFHHLSEIGENVLSGSKPHTDADFEYLRSKGIRYILQAHFLPGLTGPEKRKARKHGIQFLSVPMNASPIAPLEKHVNEALAIMRNKAYEPVYVHCVLGRDRTSLLMGIYRIYFMGMKPQKAYAEMKAAGFRDAWFVKGLQRYFDHHLSVPPNLANLSGNTQPAH